jgi:hypothetical protein
MLTRSIRASSVSYSATNVNFTACDAGDRYDLGVYRSNAIRHMVSKRALLNNISDMAASFSVKARHIIPDLSFQVEHITRNRNIRCDENNRILS